MSLTYSRIQDFLCVQHTMCTDDFHDNVIIDV
jgi:hypothetical protein